ncbi:hypothetical protein Gohar_002242 [Gossypium harknessii]|uniref:DUF7745 domain-containing protein n=1 Tax=Gossypium harknessii TaxID=34285 RepID=A0A7J9HLF8_9ROSI|nr:hypothetical protein [Gossypium harknessii]
MSKRISTYFELLPNIGIPPIAVSVLGRIQIDKTYSRATTVSTLLKGLMNITGMSEQWDLILVHSDLRKGVDIFALSIYGLVIFPKALGRVDNAISDLFDRLDKRVTSVLVILARTFRSLTACRRAGEERVIGCAQLLLGWFQSHF